MKNSTYMIIALLPLLIGTIYHLIFREPIFASTWLGMEALHFQKHLTLLNWLPSFVHQFSFLILSWLAVEKQYTWYILFLWSIINITFELAQGLESKYLYYLPNILEKYFKNGTYSHEDILAIVFATMIAYTIMNKYTKKEK